MLPVDVDSDEEEVALLAVQALTAAHRRAVQSGRPVLVVENGELVRIGPLGRTVVKTLPPRHKVLDRIKRALS